jgi:hypothetical protein
LFLLSGIGLLIFVGGHRLGGLPATGLASTLFGRWISFLVNISGIRLITIVHGIRISCQQNTLGLMLERLELKCFLGPVQLLAMANMIEELGYFGFLHRPCLEEHHVLW